MAIDAKRILENIPTGKGLFTGFAEGVERELERELTDEGEGTIRPPIDYACPDILWQGIFHEVAQRLERYSWEIWAGTLAAMAATAHKNLHWYYHRDLYGMIYLLLIAPTGFGKGLVIDVAYDLLPDGYCTRDSVQSGPALAPILATIERGKSGECLNAISRPVLLLIEEWTTLIKASKIEFSSLQEVLNTLFHRQRAWNLSRSDRSGSGGDTIIPNPTLSICATTTEGLLRTYIGDKEIHSGFLNRYFILPGTYREWKFYTAGAANTSTNVLNGMLDPLRSYAWGAGRSVWEAYTKEALLRLRGWAEANLQPVMNKDDIESEAMKRLHVYLHIISLLYAWQDRFQLVEIQHVEAAIAAVAVSQEFLIRLVRQEQKQVPPFKQWEMDFEAKILSKLEERPGSSRRDLYLLLHRHGTTTDLAKMVERLLQNGVVAERKKGQKLGLWKV
jgi:hypothetical protein